MLKASAQDTKSRIVEAALQNLKAEGFAGSSARAIAKRGGFNQALIFYHFGTLNDLLLAALDKTSTERMARYRGSLTKDATLDEKVEVATRLYREDLESGHITVLSELITGSIATPELGAQVVIRMQPWIDFAEDVLIDVIAESPFASLIKPRTLAFAVVALYIGVDLLSHLEKDRGRADELFKMSAQLGRLLHLLKSS